MISVVISHFTFGVFAVMAGLTGTRLLKAMSRKPREESP